MFDSFSRATWKRYHKLRAEPDYWEKAPQPRTAGTPRPSFTPDCPLCGNSDKSTISPSGWRIRPRGEGIAWRWICGGCNKLFTEIHLEKLKAKQKGCTQPKPQPLKTANLANDAPSAAT